MDADKREFHNRIQFATTIQTSSVSLIGMSSPAFLVISYSRPCAAKNQSDKNGIQAADMSAIDWLKYQYAVLLRANIYPPGERS